MECHSEPAEKRMKAVSPWNEPATPAPAPAAHCTPALAGGARGGGEADEAGPARDGAGDPCTCTGSALHTCPGGRCQGVRCRRESPGRNANPPASRKRRAPRFLEASVMGRRFGGPSGLWRGRRPGFLGTTVIAHRRRGEACLAPTETERCYC